MDSATAQFTDRMGVLFEAEGQPRIAGRLFGYLLVSEDPRSLDQLAETLHVSKASVSTNARMLADKGMLERLCRPGDRHDYYGVAPELFSRSMAERLKRWQRFAQAVGDARRMLPDPERARSAPRLRGLRDGLRLHGGRHRPVARAGGSTAPAARRLATGGKR